MVDADLNADPANVPLPRRSELGPATPSTHYDDLPSPSVSKSASKRKSTLGASPRTSRRLTSGANLDSPFDDDDLADDSLLLTNDDVGDQGTPSVSPRKRKTLQRVSDVSELLDDADGSTETVKHADRSRKNTASHRTTNLEYEEPEDFYDASGDLADDVGAGYDDHGDMGDVGADDVDDDDVAQSGLQDVQEDEEEEEEEQLEHSEESGDETAVERARPTVQRKKSPKARGRPRQTTAEWSMPKPRSIRMSHIGPGMSRLTGVDQRNDR